MSKFFLYCFVSLQPSEKCSRIITRTFKRKVDQQGATYTLVSPETKKFTLKNLR